MININRTPTYYELVDLSNNELTTCIKKSLENLQLAQKRGEDTTEKEQIYWAFQEERLKRVNLGKKRRVSLPPSTIDSGSSADHSN